jgi:hypothetical protein
MGSPYMIQILSVINIGLGNQKLMEYTDTQDGDRISLLQARAKEEGV